MFKTLRENRLWTISIVWGCVFGASDSCAQNPSVAFFRSMLIALS